MKKLCLFALLLVPLAAHAQIGPTYTKTGNITSVSSTAACLTATGCVKMDISPNNGAVSITIGSTTYAAILAFEGSANDGDFTSLQCTSVADATAATGATDTAGVWQCPTAGLINVQVRSTTYTSGTAVVTLQSSNSSVKRQTPGAGTGTVTAIATSAPLTGGTITTSGTIACGTCLSSSSTIGTGAIPIGQGTRVLLTDADLSFTGGDTLNAAKIIGGIITDSALTATRITFAGTAGLLADDADLTFTGGNTLTTTNLVVNGTTTGLPFNAVWSLPGAPAGTTTYPVFVSTGTLNFPDDWAGSTCKVLTDATATWTATVKKNGSSVGTVAVATNGVCTFLTSGGATAFSSGDYMTITTPTADATLADVMFNFVATRG